MAAGRSGNGLRLERKEPKDKGPYGVATPR